MTSNVARAAATDVLGFESQWRSAPRDIGLAQSVSPLSGVAGARASGIYLRPEIANDGRVTVGSSLSSSAFDRLISLKSATAEVAMHLTQAWRSGLFAQLDQLLDAEEWDVSDQLPSPASFRTFLRLITYLPIKKRPSLGATSAGNILAAWIRDRDRLTMEFQPDDHIRWSLSKQQAGERETASGHTMVRRLSAVLRPYDPELWFAS